MFHLVLILIDMSTLSKLLFTECQYIYKGTGFPLKASNPYNIFKLIWITDRICMSSVSELILKTTSTRISAYRLCQLEDWQGYLELEDFIKKKCKIYRKKCKNYRKGENFTEKSVRITKKVKNFFRKKCAK